MLKYQVIELKWLFFGGCQAEIKWQMKQQDTIINKYMKDIVGINYTLWFRVMIILR